MSSSSGAAKVVHHDSTLGAILIGGIFAISLWGITSSQTFSFFKRSSQDRLNLKLLVGFLWTIDTFDTCIVSYLIYQYLVTNYANPYTAETPAWSAKVHIGVKVTVITIIRSMLLVRVYLLSQRNAFITAYLTVLSLLDLSGIIAVTVKCKLGSSFKQTVSELTPLVFTNLATTMLLDISLAAALCFYLHKSRTGIKSTNSIIDTLIAYVINTTLLVAIDAVILLILCVTKRGTLYFLICYLPLGKLYLNGYLASLNAREGLRDRMMSSVHTLDHIFAPKNGESTPGGDPVIEIRVMTPSSTIVSDGSAYSQV